MSRELYVRSLTTGSMQWRDFVSHICPFYQFRKSDPFCGTEGIMFPELFESDVINSIYSQHIAAQSEKMFWSGRKLPRKNNLRELSFGWYLRRIRTRLHCWNQSNRRTRACIYVPFLLLRSTQIILPINPL